MKEEHLKLATLLLALYAFILSISAIGAVFKAVGADYSEQIIASTTDPLAAFFVGVVATALIQSSSATTSLVVLMVDGGLLTLSCAIPIIMGANMGTSITNTIVSLGHVSSRRDFEKAFSAATVHDFFNILAAAVLLPIEIMYHPIESSARVLAGTFASMGGLKLVSPLDYIIKPVIAVLKHNLPLWLILVLAMVTLFLALKAIVNCMRSLVMDRMQLLLDRFLFRTAFISFILGVVVTAAVQSSSITTSLVIPLAGAGLVTLEMIFPYTLGANIGTTITAFLAALVTKNELAVTAASAHLLFNIFGIVIWYPLRQVPIGLARRLAEVVSEQRKLALAYMIFAFYIVPGIVIFMIR
ncbi:MAG: Na/Pi symporter [Candidatus Undinarchaeales archaeon]|nr:Na/Pi symporter [Candidatus Undinarchaeales archaeon]MDP7493164.1 Na/Pi symporter [Candidatus Undinarchaeales archaeon]